MSTQEAADLADLIAASLAAGFLAKSDLSAGRSAGFSTAACADAPLAGQYAAERC
jgi:hypothetical protein